MDIDEARRAIRGQVSSVGDQALAVWELAADKSRADEELLPGLELIECVAEMAAWNLHRRTGVPFGKRETGRVFITSPRFWQFLLGAGDSTAAELGISARLLPLPTRVAIGLAYYTDWPRFAAAAVLAVAETEVFGAVAAALGQLRGVLSGGASEGAEHEYGRIKSLDLASRFQC